MPNKRIFSEESNTKYKRIFISYSSDDKVYGDLIEDYLCNLGFPLENIFYSSSTHKSHKVQSDKDTFASMITEIQEGDHFIFILSNSFYHSAACNAEMGAVWLKQNDLKTKKTIRKKNSKSIYSIFCVPGFSPDTIQGLLNPYQKTVEWDKIERWDNIFSCFPEIPEKTKIRYANEQFSNDYNTILKNYGSLNILGSAHYCPPLNEQVVRTIFNSAISDVLICDTDIKWLLENDFINILVKKLESNVNFNVYFLLSSSDNQTYKYPTIRENTSKIEAILDSLNKILELMESKKEFSKRIHIRLNTSGRFILTGFAKDIEIDRKGGAGNEVEIYSVLPLYDDMKNNPVLRVSKKYSKDQFELYKEYFQNIWFCETELSAEELRVRYNDLCHQYTATLTGGALIASYWSKNNISFIKESTYATDYGRMFHQDDIENMNKSQYSEQFRRILEIWRDEKRKLRADEQVIFMFERIIFSQVFDSALKNEEYYHLLTSITNDSELRKGCLEKILQDILVTIADCDMISQKDGQQTRIDQYTETIKKLTKSMQDLEKARGNDSISTIISTVIHNYLGLSYYHTATLLEKETKLDLGCKHSALKDILNLDNNKPDIVTVENMQEYLLSKAVYYYERILRSKEGAILNGDVIEAHVQFNLGQAYSLQLKLNTHNSTEGEVDNKSWVDKMNAAYLISIKVCKELSSNPNFPTAIQQYFALLAESAMLDYVGDKKDDSNKSDTQDTSPLCDIVKRLLICEICYKLINSGDSQKTKDNQYSLDDINNALIRYEICKWLCSENKNKMKRSTDNGEKSDSETVVVSKKNIDALWEEIIKYPFDGVHLFETVKTKYAEYSNGWKH